MNEMFSCRNCGRICFTDDPCPTYCDGCGATSWLIVPETKEDFQREMETLTTPQVQRKFRKVLKRARELGG